MVPNDFSFDFFDFEQSVRYYIVKDQFGKECWYDPNKEIMTPIDGCFEEKVMPFERKIKLDDEPNLN